MYSAKANDIRLSPQTYCRRAGSWLSKTLLLLSFVLIYSSHVTAQFETVQVQVYANGFDMFGNGSGLSFFDFNKDGWDDITLSDAGFPIKIYLNNQNSTFSLIATVANVWNAKHPVWVDFDNDNDYDLFVTFRQHSCKLFRNDGDFDALVDITDSLGLPSSTGNSYGCAWGDYDKDSYLDVYIANFHLSDTEETNWLLHNNGDGTFTNVTDLLHVGLNQVTSFQPCWVDIDNNGWQDLYVVNDHDYTNAMFMNDGVELIDMAAAIGLDTELLSMSNSITDYDQDGDFDIYMSNGYDGNYLMRNDSAYFINVADETNTAIYSSCWNSMWLDVDNNGYEDLHVCLNDPVEDNRMLINDANGSFNPTLIATGASENRSYCAAKGDYDNDGQIDFFNFSQQPALLSLFHNVYPDVNYWIKCDTEGVVSNRDGIGTRVEVYCGSDVYTHYTFCGTNYLSQDSQHRLIGLAQHDIIDSLILKWPSGWVDRHYALAVNTSHVFVEGETFMASTSGTVVLTLCEGASVVLDAGEWEAYDWFDGSDQQLAVVSQEGEYEVSVTNQFGLVQSITFQVLLEQATELLFDVLHPLCSDSNDGHVVVTALDNEISTIYWNGEEGVSVLDNLSGGAYAYEILDSNNCIVEGSVILEAPPAIDISWNELQLCFDAVGSIEIQMSGGSGTLTADWNGINQQEVVAGDYLVTVTDTNQCQHAALIEVMELAPINITCVAPLACFNETISILTSVSGGAGNYLFDWNGYNPDSLYAGDYVLNVVDGNNCTATENFSVYEATEIILTPEITNAYDGANGSVVMNVAGGYAPYTYLWSNFSDTNVLLDAAQGNYTCLVTDALGCTKSIDLSVVDTQVDEVKREIVVFPNPFNNQISINLYEPCYITVKDAIGRIIYHAHLPSIVEIDTSLWSSGYYLLTAGEKTFLIEKP